MKKLRKLKDEFSKQDSKRKSKDTKGGKVKKLMPVKKVRKHSLYDLIDEEE